MITVAASGYGTNLATLTAYERGANGWTQVFGPWFAYIGRNGVAPAGAKREGDGRTPSGVFGFDFMFGVDADPGVHFPFRRITGTNIVWDDDPASANYNEWIDRNTASAGTNPEPMDTTPSYLYGVVIAYNDARTPGLGSDLLARLAREPHLGLRLAAVGRAARRVALARSGELASHRHRYPRRADVLIHPANRPFTTS